MRRIESVKALQPPLWGLGGHSQTLWGHFLFSPSLPSLGEKHLIHLPDGDQLVVYISKGQKPVMLSCFHGLSGDVFADYMQRTALLAQRLGYGYCLVNHRGVGEGEALARGPYHSGRAEDASAVIEYLRQQFPDHQQISLGFSMSGNILLYLLAGQRGSHLPDAAITVNAPINLKNAALSLQQGFSKIYDRRFVLRIGQALEKKWQLGHLSSPIKVTHKTTLADLDELYTAPYSGFKNREEYYQVCSSMPHVNKIETPVVVLTSHDDPIVNARDYELAEWSDSCLLHIERHGGHLGYVDASPKRRWLDYFLEEALRKLILK